MRTPMHASLKIGGLTTGLSGRFPSLRTRVQASWFFLLIITYYYSGGAVFNWTYSFSVNKKLNVFLIIAWFRTLMLYLIFLLDTLRLWLQSPDWNWRSISFYRHCHCHCHFADCKKRRWIMSQQLITCLCLPSHFFIFAMQVINQLRTVS